MVVEGLCGPALLYLGFSLVQITIDLYKGEYTTSFFKFIVMLIFTAVLNMLCAKGMTIISWFVVFIPFILMTYISSILFLMFGLNPDKKTIAIKSGGGVNDAPKDAAHEQKEQKEQNHKKM
jgi:hypothetical protein